MAEAEWSKAVRSWQGSNLFFSVQANSVTFHYYSDGHVAGLQRTAKSSHRTVGDQPYKVHASPQMVRNYVTM